MYAIRSYYGGLTEELVGKLDLFIVIDVLSNKGSELAHYVLPGVTFAEKRGTFINVKGRIQRLNIATSSPGIARPEWQTFAGLLNELNGESYNFV